MSAIDGDHLYDEHQLHSPDCYPYCMCVDVSGWSQAGSPQWTLVGTRLQLIEGGSDVEVDDRWGLQHQD